MDDDNPCFGHYLKVTPLQKGCQWRVEVGMLNKKALVNLERRDYIKNDPFVISYGERKNEKDKNQLF